MSKNREPEMSVINILGPGAVVKGEIQVNGDFRIDGTLNGSIQCQGKIVVGPTGKIEGEIVCQNADFSGEVRATAKVGELLTLKETANFNGDIVTGKIAIEPGARFSGNCTMNQGNSKEFRIPVTQDEIGPEEKP
ncbi:MAG TPA: polymer-forming cytoskeletal protein [Bacteroidales bacterium]|nr:polymer-forming cytoskeletal protein [Bacteroidales bacterium]HPT09060.1 polymer-forming cytoskeletal protein [Bacteroidales bacterium]